MAIGQLPVLGLLGTCALSAAAPAMAAVSERYELT